MSLASGMQSVGRLVSYAAVVSAGIVLIGGMLLILYVAPLLPKLPPDIGRIYQTPQTTVYSKSGRILTGLGEQKFVPLSLVSKDFINAVLAVEDHLFFEHPGINKLRILRGLFVTLFEPGRVEGASTITQQLAKNLFFSFEKSFKRKFLEMLIALQIEATHTKAEILEAYINQIHFGAGAQGIGQGGPDVFCKKRFRPDPV